MGELTFHEKHVDIQQRLVVPKGNRNDFGGFNYRAIEDIEIAVKPFLQEHKLTLRFDDQMVVMGGRLYVRATALLSDGTDTIATDGWAREAEAKKGMDEAQITGAASSYARKYAAGGLFLIDNGRDPDSMDNTAQKARTAPRIFTTDKTKLASPKSVDWLRDVAEKYVPVGQDTDVWIETVLTVKPSQVPQFKVKDAVDRLNEVGSAQSQIAQQRVGDTVIEPTDEPIKIEDLDY